MFLRMSFIILCLVSTQGLADVITIGTDPWCPYNCKEGDKEGISIEVMRQIFEPHGHKVTVQYLPWARAILFLKQGKITNFTSAAKADCEECLYADNPTTIMKNTIFTRVGETEPWQGLASLKGKIIGVINNYTYGKELTKYITKHQKDYTKVIVNSGPNALDSNISMLIKGRVDFIVDEVTVLSYRASKMGVRKKIKPIHAISSVPLFLGFSPKDPKSKQYAMLASKTLREMKKDGRLKKIFASYDVECTVCDNANL